MSWSGNELITVALPKSGEARTACYVIVFVQPTANTKTCLPINNYGEYRKFLFDLFSATANRRKCLKNGKFTANTKRRHFFFDSANSKIGLKFLSPAANCKKGVFFLPAYGKLDTKMPTFYSSPTAKGKDATKKSLRRKSVERPKSCVALWAM